MRYTDCNRVGLGNTTEKHNSNYKCQIENIVLTLFYTIHPIKSNKLSPAKLPGYFQKHSAYKRHSAINWGTTECIFGFQWELDVFNHISNELKVIKSFYRSSILQDLLPKFQLFANWISSCWLQVKSHEIDLL